MTLVSLHDVVEAANGIPALECGLENLQEGFPLPWMPTCGVGLSALLPGEPVQAIPRASNPRDRQTEAGTGNGHLGASSMNSPPSGKWTRVLAFPVFFPKCSTSAYC